MCVCAAAVVVTFEAAHDVTLAAVWDGGRWCHVHVVDEGTYGPRIESWDMWHPATQSAAIPCTPDALRELVLFRLADPDAVRTLERRTVGYAGCVPTEPRRARPVPAVSLN